MTADRLELACVGDEKISEINYFTINVNFKTIKLKEFFLVIYFATLGSELLKCELMATEHC